jgi:hypothetical protein
VLTLATSAGVVKGRPISAVPQSIRLINNAVIEFRSWEREQNLQGTTISGGVVDEAGMLTPEAHAAISARRSETLGPIRYIGNPGMVSGPFRKLCSLAEEAATDASLAGQWSLHRWTWKDKLDELERTDPRKAYDYKRFIEFERTSLPEFEFRRLYEAEWTSDEAAMFHGIPEPDGPPVDEPVNGEQYVIGVDVAQETDYMVALVLGINRRRADHMVRWRGLPYPLAEEQLAALAAKWSAPLVIETNGPGKPIYDRLLMRGIPVIAFETTGPSKNEIIVNLSAELKHGRLRLADLHPLQYELSIFRYERMPSGNYRYSAPSGEHDDTVMALAFALSACQRSAMTDYGWIA